MSCIQYRHPVEMVSLTVNPAHFIFCFKNSNTAYIVIIVAGCNYVFTAQTTGLWKTACDSLAQTRETAQIYGSRILIASPTSAYTQYK